MSSPIVSATALSLALRYVTSSRLSPLLQEVARMVRKKLGIRLNYSKQDDGLVESVLHPRDLTLILKAHFKMLESKNKGAFTFVDLASSRSVTYRKGVLSLDIVVLLQQQEDPSWDPRKLYATLEKELGVRVKVKSVKKGDRDGMTTHVLQISAPLSFDAIKNVRLTGPVTGRFTSSCR